MDRLIFVARYFVCFCSIVESNSSPNLQQQAQGNSNAIENGSNDSFPMQCIRFSPFQQQNWHILCDQSLQELWVCILIKILMRIFIDFTLFIWSEKKCTFLSIQFQQSSATLSCRCWQRFQFLKFRWCVRMPKEKSLSNHLSCASARCRRHICTNGKWSWENQIVSFTLLWRKTWNTVTNHSHRTKPIGSFKETVSSSAVSILI